MRIGFFGGSFDPPHLGHLVVGRAAAEAFLLDQILWAPTGHQPLKPDGPSAPFEDRLAMVSLLCELDRHFQASSLDAPLPDGSPNFTVDTLTTLRAGCSTADSIFVLVGADAFLDLRRWKAPDALLALAEWIVVSRPSASLQQLQRLQLTPDQAGRVHLLDHVHEPANATGIRAQLRAGSDCTDLLPDSILRYIREHHLYET